MVKTFQRYGAKHVGEFISAHKARDGSLVLHWGEVSISAWMDFTREKMAGSLRELLLVENLAVSRGKSDGKHRERLFAGGLSQDLA